MKIQLPPRSNGQPLTLDGECRQVIIIGANGSGKTRFARQMAADLGDRAFHLSALRALFVPTVADSRRGSIDSIYETMLAGQTMMRSDARGELNRLVALLLHEEMLNLLSYKTERQMGHDTRLKATRLDRLIHLWHRIFPDSKMLLESGHLNISRLDTPSSQGDGVDSHSFSMSRLSDGEKAVMYYVGATLFAPPSSVIFVDNPGLFLHPSTMRTVWDSIEEMRPDCTFVYITHDLDFASTRGSSRVVWVQSFDAPAGSWKYDILPRQEGISEEVYMAIVGARKPVLFIEGDGKNSIDAKLYPLIFREYTVKSLGSCNKVIEAVRTFNDLSSFHSLDSHGIVDRDRRDDHEVAYLRGRRILVPEVAEIENLLMLEEVVRAVADYNHVGEDQAFAKVKRGIIKIFAHDLRAQALLHTRHRVKMTVSYRIDGRFNNINGLEEHMTDLIKEINPRGIYEGFCREFRRYTTEGDYASILRVYNQKSMIPDSNVGNIVGLKRQDKNTYINAILNILKTETPQAERIRRAVSLCLGINTIGNVAKIETTEARQEPPKTGRRKR